MAMGNWTVRFTDNWQVIGGFDEDLGEHRIIAECGVDEWSEHNARLIVDMAEALRMAVAADTAEDWSRAMDYARAALAKAGCRE